MDMTMYQVFQNMLAEQPRKVEIVSARNSYSKVLLKVRYEGEDIPVSLLKTCAPGAEHDYCWTVLAEAMAHYYMLHGDAEEGKRWLAAQRDPSLITADTF